MERYIKEDQNLVGDKYTARDVFGIHPGLDLGVLMADFYVLERLQADGSKQAAAMFKELTEWAAPIIARYMVVICGGELRHIIAQTGGGVSCNCYVSGECYIGCGNCGEECECYNPDPECECECYCEMMECDCDLEEDDECEISHTCPICEGECEGDCFTKWCDDCYPILGDEWRRPLSEDVQRIIEQGYDCGRDSVWHDFVRLAEREGWQYAAEQCVRGFADLDWECGFGGHGWETIARIARDFFRGKLKPRTFMDRAWSLQHNNGIMFNKLWSYDVCGKLQNQLEVQEMDHYDSLSNGCSPDARKVWRSRIWAMSNYEEHDPVWYGSQPTEEVVW